MAKNVFCEVTVTFDLWPPNSNQFIFESKWTFVSNLKKFPQGVPEILRSGRMGWVRLYIQTDIQTDGRTDGRTDGQPENIMTENKRYFRALSKLLPVAPSYFEPWLYVVIIIIIITCIFIAPVKGPKDALYKWRQTKQTTQEQKIIVATIAGDNRIN